MILDRSYKMDAHAHNRIEIMLLVSGSLDVLFGFEATPPQSRAETFEPYETVRLKKGQFILIEENIKHDIRILQDNTEFLNLEFTIQACAQADQPFNYKSYLSRFSFLKNLCDNMHDYVTGDDTVGLKETILKVHDTFFESSIDRELFLFNDLLLIEFLIDTARCRISEKPLTNNYHINKVIRLIHMNLSKDISIDFLANKIGINKSYLQRLFKEQTGKTIITYLNELRIEQAKKLLANKNFDIIDVAIEVGFNNRQNFSIAFKKQTGETPSEFRKSALNKEYTTY